MLEGYRPTTEEEAKYYTLTNIPDIAGTCGGICICVGGGKGMWEDLAEAKEIAPTADIMAVNVAAMFIPEAKHIYSMHSAQINAIAQFRIHEYAGDKAIVHGVKKYDFIHHTWKMRTPASTSGLAAPILAKVLGYNKFILAGVPMDDSGYFYKQTLNESFPDKARLLEVHNVKEIFGGKIKSMSGRTAKSFGKPDTEWVRS